MSLHKIKILFCLFSISNTCLSTNPNVATLEKNCATFLASFAQVLGHENRTRQAIAFFREQSKLFPEDRELSRTVYALGSQQSRESLPEDLVTLMRELSPSSYKDYPPYGGHTILLTRESMLSLDKLPLNENPVLNRLANQTARNQVRQRSVTVLEALLNRLNGQSDARLVDAFAGTQSYSRSNPSFPGHETTYGLLPAGREIQEEFQFAGQEIEIFKKDRRYTYIELMESAGLGGVAQFKVYFTFTPERVNEYLPNILSSATSAGAAGAKVLNPDVAVKRRDRLIVYFSNITDAANFAKNQSNEMNSKGVIGDELPFTFRVGENENSPVHLAVDSINRGISWRGLVTQKISDILARCETSECIRIELLKNGIDPDFWLPLEYVQDAVRTLQTP